jgi:hypothetical protein
MAESLASRNQRVADYIGEITAISLHTADPGTTGANEVTGGSPAYARQVPAYTAPVNAQSDLAASLLFDIPDGVTITHWGVWAGATFFNCAALSKPAQFAGQGTYGLTTAPISA